MQEGWMSCRQQPAPPPHDAAKMSPRISTGPEPVLAAHAPSPPERAASARRETAQPPIWASRLIGCVCLFLLFLGLSSLEYVCNVFCRFLNVVVGDLSVLLRVCVLDVIFYFFQFAVELCVLYSVT